METNQGFARQLGYYYLASGDPNILDTMRDEMKKVTPQDIMRVAQKYLTTSNRNVVELVTSKKTATGELVEPKQEVEIRADDDQSSPTEANDTGENQ